MFFTGHSLNLYILFPKLILIKVKIVLAFKVGNENKLEYWRHY